MPGEEDFEETHNGLRKKGDLGDIAEFADEVKNAMERGDFSEESVSDFDRWKPEKEDGRKDLDEKTLEKATRTEKKLEGKSSGAPQDLENASREIEKAGEKMRDGDPPNREIVDASKEASKPLISRLSGFIRGIEEKVYSRVMLPLNDYYFDSEDVAVDIKERDDGEFEMDVKTTEEDKRERLKDEIKGNEG